MKNRVLVVVLSAGLMLLASTAFAQCGCSAPVYAPSYTAYAPVAAPYVSYYAPSVPVPYVSYYAPPLVTPYAAYSPVVTAVPAPVVVYPRVFVPGQPVRNFFRAAVWY